MHRWGLLLAVSLGTKQVLGELYQGPTPEILNRTYDVIVVGAGAAGAVMASRLSEDPNTTVLLIEAGNSDFENTNIIVPALLGALPNSKFDWNYTTTPQPGLNNRAIGYPRGFVLGGSTAINDNTYCRGTRDDFDRWANVTGDDIWAYDNLYPFILKVDRITPPADGHNTTGEIDPAVHGNGQVPISLEGFSLPINPLVINTTTELPDEFPFNLDYNGGNTIGISWAQSTIHNGERADSATAYLSPAFNRSNLDVVVNTRVTKVVSVGTQNGMPIMRGVQIAQTADGPVSEIQAAKEVILSAGSLNSPQILMLSGIGDAQELSSLGIESIVDLPFVGQNLQDHVFLTTSWSVNSNLTLDDINRNSTLAAQALAQWQVNGTGPLGLSPASQFGWLRVSDSVFESFGIEDPSAGPTSAHFELIPVASFFSKSVPLPATGHFITFAEAVISPIARGNLTLNSADPFVAPLINPNLLGSPVDLAVMREAIAAARAFVAAPAWQGFIEAEFGDFANAHTDDELNAYITANSDTVDHPVGTVAMGKDGESALDSNLRVRGTVGLRVVDASAFPFIPSAHTMGPTYVLAERAAALVKSSLN